MDVAAMIGRLRRGSVECHTEEDLRKKLSSGRQLRVKLGVDPTSANLHLGHTVPLNRLRAFQDLGHKAVLIIGDYTARIGDPSGRDSTRPPLTQETIDANAKTYQDQAFKVLDPSADKLEIVRNSQWLEPFVRGEHVLDGKKGTSGKLFSVLQTYTVNQLMQREDFAKRQAGGQPITLIEILYPIFQGYDSVAVRADIELGGNDQLFNLLKGREMQKDFGQEPQVALTFPLLVGTDGGKKMSKSYGNAIGLTEPPRDMFGKVMKITDESMRSYYELLTTEDLKEVAGLHPMEAKKRLAQSLTARFHGEAAGRAEREFFDSTFSKKELPTDLQSETFKATAAFWSQLLVQLQLAPSRKEAQRLIAQGAFKIDGVAVKEDAVAPDYFKGPREGLLQVGKHKFKKVNFIP